MTLEELERKYSEFEARLTRVEAIEAIQKLTYQYFDDLCLGKTEHLIDYFCEDCSFVLPRETLQGKEAVKKYLVSLEGWHTGAETNFLVHPIIDVEGDRAKGNWFFYFVNTYYLTSQPMFVTAFTYDNEYALENGQWKLKQVQWNVRFGPPGRPPFPGLHGSRVVKEEELRGML